MITDINNEDRLVQQTFADHLRDRLGWESVYAYNAETFGPQGLLGRSSERDVVLARDLRAALARLNPDLPIVAREQAVETLTRTDFVRYAGASGDFNPLHVEEAFAARSRASGGCSAGAGALLGRSFLGFFSAAGVVVGSAHVMGHGVAEGLRDVIYVRPSGFHFAESRRIAGEIEALNHRLVAEGRGYVLLGFGRWGSSDPWLGIPVRWAQISGARAIVEATLPQSPVDPSQGSHFFHNLTSFGVSYFTVRPDEARGVDWAWLDTRPAASETEFVRHVRLEAPLRVEVDGRSGRGVIRAGTGEATT